MQPSNQSFYSSFVDKWCIIGNQPHLQHHMKMMPHQITRLSSNNKTIISFNTNYMFRLTLQETFKYLKCSTIRPKVKKGSIQFESPYLLGCWEWNILDNFTTTLYADPTSEVTVELSWPFLRNGHKNSYIQKITDQNLVKEKRFKGITYISTKSFLRGFVHHAVAAKLWTI